MSSTTFAERIATLTKLVRQYQRTRESFAAINEELRSLARTVSVDEMLRLNEDTMASTERLLVSAEDRLRRERELQAAAEMSGRVSAA